MSFRCFRFAFALLAAMALTSAASPSAAQSSSSSSGSSSSRPRKTVTLPATFDTGSVTNGIYRNRALRLVCKIPEGWVLRTEEMNSAQNPDADSKNDSTDPSKLSDAQESGVGAKVLLAAFSRPPEAKGQEVNSSILIAVEPMAAYPGLKDAEQYFGPLSEVATAQGFTQDAAPYEIAIGAQTLVRADFHKDVGTRVMRQATLAMLSHGYAVSITFLAGTEDQLQELIDGLEFETSAKRSQSPE